MKIKWYGHAAFKITTDEGIRVIVDPYQSGAFGGALSYGKISEEADIVLTSHDHEDHNYVKDINGKYRLVNTEGIHKELGLTIEGFACYHDPSKGAERGKNIMFVIEADGVRIAHMGDLGHSLTEDAVRRMGRIDVVLLPVGGLYTIDAEEATRVMADIKPRITIPMHYKTEKCNFPMAGVEAFSAGKTGVKMARAFEIDIRRESLPEEPEIVVMEYAL